MKEKKLLVCNIAGFIKHTQLRFSLYSSIALVSLSWAHGPCSVKLYCSELFDDRFTSSGIFRELDSLKLNC